MITKATDEELDFIAKESFRASAHPMSWINTFAQGYRQAENDLEIKLTQKLIDIMASDTHGLAPEQLAILKKEMEDKLPKKPFKSKVIEMGRRKIITENEIPLLKQMGMITQRDIYGQE